MTEPSTQLVGLREVPGRFVTARAFAEEHLDILEPLEGEFLRERLDWVRDERLADLVPCMARLEDPNNGEATRRALKSGERSAVLPESSVQLKGCRPLATERSFPSAELHFGETRIAKTEVPFGVMTPEQVMREILGYCFMREHELPFQGTPVGVWLYEVGREGSVGLLSRIRGDVRVESFLEEPSLTVGEVIASKRGGCSLGIIGSEMKVKGLNVWAWVESKATTLSLLHAHGGFRGVLNSNLGNDVLLGRDARSRVALCDFDTFGMVLVPKAPDREFLEPFLVLCLVEVAMGSLPIVEYVDVPEDASTEERADALGAEYFSKSSLWRAYWRHLVRQLSKHGCRTTTIEDALHRARCTEAFVSVLSTRILDATALRSMGRDRRLVVRHSEVV